MTAAEKLLELAQNGNAQAQEMIRLTYSEMVFADIHLSIANKINHLADHFGVNCRDERRNITKLKLAARELDKGIRKQLGADKIAEDFGDRADLIQDVIMLSSFLSYENLIKLQSQIKLMIK